MATEIVGKTDSGPPNLLLLGIFLLLVILFTGPIKCSFNSVPIWTVIEKEEIPHEADNWFSIGPIGIKKSADTAKIITVETQADSGEVRKLLVNSEDFAIYNIGDCPPHNWVKKQKRVK